MKLKTLLTGVLLTLGLTAATSVTALAAVPTGRLRKVTENAITGWAYNKDLPNSAIKATVIVSDKNTGKEVFRQTVTAGEYDKSLERDGKGDGCHAFTAEIDWTSLPNGEYLIQGCSGESELAGSKTYTNSLSQLPETTAAANTDGHSLVPLGIFKTTGYCPCLSCSEGWGRHTCTGAIASARHTVAVDPRVIPYGSQLMINGVIYTAEDRGGAVKGNHIDIFFDTHGETLQHGTTSTEVYLVQS